jgi:hypothetical protein
MKQLGPLANFKAHPLKHPKRVGIYERIGHSQPTMWELGILPLREISVDWLVHAVQGVHLQKHAMIYRGSLIL